MRFTLRQQPCGGLAFTLALALALASLSAGAQQTIVVTPKPTMENILLFNPGDLLNGVISIEYERAFTTFFGLSFGASVSTFRGVFTPAGAHSYTAVGPEIGARFHFIQNAPAGLWVGPTVNMVYVAANSGGTVTRAFGYGVGAAIGYNFIFRHFAFQVGGGGGFNDYGDGIAWSPRLRLGIGGAF